jgi:hypothetical protein
VPLPLQLIELATDIVKLQQNLKERQAIGSNSMFEKTKRIRAYRRMVQRVDEKLPSMESRLTQFDGMFKLETDAPKSFYKIHYFLADIKKMAKAAKTYISKSAA